MMQAGADATRALAAAGCLENPHISPTASAPVAGSAACGLVLPLRPGCSAKDVEQALRPRSLSTDAMDREAEASPELDALRRLLLNARPDLDWMPWLQQPRGGEADSLAPSAHTFGRGRPPSRPGTPLRARSSSLARAGVIPASAQVDADGPGKAERAALTGRVLRRAARVPVMLRDVRGKLARQRPVPQRSSER